MPENAFSHGSANFFFFFFLCVCLCVCVCVFVCVWTCRFFTSQIFNFLCNMLQVGDVIQEIMSLL